MPNNVIRPVTAADVEHAIRLTGWSAYLYLGSSQDQGWANAQLIDESPNFPRLVVYRVADREEVAQWTHGVRTGGLVVTDKGAYSTHISRSETESIVDVIIAISRAIGGV
jgi:hypothetical protein